MNRPSRIYKFALLSAMAVLMVSVFFSQRYLNTQREVLGLTRIAPLENAPPLLEFTTKALGGFRGLIANALWLRANELQEEGKFFEMVQLSDWITKLEPHLAQVWVHLAWNMAYNISIKFNDPADRWGWVYRGIELLRDQGLRYNPREPLIYREIAWIFQHKIGHYLDDAHEFYKANWAEKMSEVLGRSGPPNFDELINPTTPEAKEHARKLREVYKMDPAFMKEVDQEYGPLEWRLPETSSIYWGALGLRECTKEKLKKEEFVQLRRVIFQSLQLAFMRGRLVSPEKTGGEFLYLPNLDIIRKTSDSYLEMAQLQPDMRENILNAHKNFISTAIYYLYLYNRKAAAQEWFNYWKKTYPATTPNMSLDDYAFLRIAEDAGGTDPVRVRAAIRGQLETAFLSYAIGEEEPAINSFGWARKLWTRYTEEIGTSSNMQKRIPMPPFQTLYDETLKSVLGPESGMNPVLKQQLRTRLNLPADYGAPSPSAPAPPPSIAAPQKKQP
jgi:hypothetical protein